MARSSNQKLKTLYILKLLMTNSDEEHPVSMAELLGYLDSCGITAERKSIYDDIEALRSFGVDIEQRHGSGYYIASRSFELPELKLLVDSVQSSKFITHKKTMSLIKKIESLASAHQARSLSRQVFVTNRIKTMNESIYYNVDKLSEAIVSGKKVRFKYFEYAVDKSRVFRRGGEPYEVSPFALSWDDENYYLVAFDSEAGIIKHYRVDKMTEISVAESERDGGESFNALDMGIYAKSHFGMFGGSDRKVRLRFKNHLVGVVIDRFGKDIMVVPEDGEHFTVTVEVAVSPQFFAWLCGLGSEVKIVSPPDVVQGMQEHIASIAALY